MNHCQIDNSRKSQFTTSEDLNDNNRMVTLTIDEYKRTCVHYKMSQYDRSFSENDSFEKKR